MPRLTIPYDFDYRHNTVPSDQINVNFTYLLDAIDKIQTDSAGVIAPDNPFDGMVWLDTNCSPPLRKFYFDETWYWTGIWIGDEEDIPESPMTGAIFVDREDNNFSYWDGSDWQDLWRYEVLVQYSVTGDSLWHDDPVDEDCFMRFSTDNGNSWGDATLFRGFGTVGTTTGDIARWNNDTGAWEVAAEPLEFRQITLTPSEAAMLDIEGSLFYKSTDKSVYVCTDDS